MSTHSEPATEIPEEQITSWLFLQSPARGLLIQGLELPPRASICLQVPRVRIAPAARGPGDIDVLLAHKDKPEESIAIEVKRVKVVPETFYTRMPGKFQGLRKGVIQANLLSEISFFRTMLLLIVVTDGRQREGLNFASRGLTWELARQVDDFPDRQKLASKVDIGVVEIVQPVDKSIFDAAGIGVRIAHRGERALQPETITAAVRKHFSFVSS